MRKRRSATIIEVAKHAGVSPSTVSRVLNGTAAVLPETERRVREAIRIFKFTPHPAARQLVMRRTHTIGMIVPEISGAYFSLMLKGIETGVREAGCDLLIYSSRINQHPKPLSEHNTDGLIIFPESFDPDDLRHLYQIDFPVVLLHQTPPPDCPYPVVTVENSPGAEKITRHLIEVHGRRRIVFLTGPTNHEDTRLREQGYRDALEANGIVFDPALVKNGGFDDSVAFIAINELLEDQIKFDAVFAGDDDAAAGVITALEQAGHTVPGDISVVGFDDVDPARFYNPPLTTVRVPIDQVGYSAACILNRMILREPVEPKTIFPGELVIRQSCGCRGQP